MAEKFAFSEKLWYLCTQNIQNTTQMAKIISVLNDKGGVAKTTTVANLGTALWLMGKRVLLIDTDKQCNLTITLDRTAAQGVDSIYEWLLDASIEPPIYSRYEGLSFIPSSRKMSNINTLLADKVHREHYLKKRLSTIEDNFDYILIDCAPGGEGLMNINALAASNGVIIPAKTDFYSIHGKNSIMSLIEDVREGMEIELPVLGYLFVMFDAHTKIGKEIRRYFAENSEVPMIPVQIRRCIKVDECIQNEQTLYEYAPDSTAAEDYMRLAEYILGLPVQPRKKSNPQIWGSKANAAYEQFIKEREEN